MVTIIKDKEIRRIRLLEYKRVSLDSEREYDIKKYKGKVLFFYKRMKLEAIFEIEPWFKNDRVIDMTRDHINITNGDYKVDYLYRDEVVLRILKSIRRKEKKLRYSR